MGVVMQRAGGGKVTVTGLTADILKQGTTVTVMQGSKTVQQVAGVMSDAAGMTSAYITGGGGTRTCSLAVPAGTFRAFCAGVFDWYNGSASGSTYMTWKGTRIASGTQITGPGTLTGYAYLDTNYAGRAYAFCAIAYG